jgi:hypothetical protein
LPVICLANVVEQTISGFCTPGFIKQSLASENILPEQQIGIKPPEIASRGVVWNPRLPRLTAR